jgi:FkbM family methyltransferase
MRLGFFLGTWTPDVEWGPIRAPSLIKRLSMKLSEEKLQTAAPAPEVKPAAVEGADIAALVWDRVLTVYGRWLPNHPRKWSVLNALARRAQRAWDQPRVARCRGDWFELNLRHWVDRDVYFLQYEYWESRLLRRIVRPGWTVVDVGANIGYYTLLFARLVGPSGCVYSFEPQASTYADLSRNISLNEPGNVRIFRLALSDSVGDAPLADTGERPHATHIASVGEASSERVPLITLDSFLAAESAPGLDLIKVDIEGYEMRFLLGAAETLARFRPIVQLELNPGMLARFDASAESVVKQLADAGYGLYQLRRWRLRPLCALPAPGEICNVLALHRERHADEIRRLGAAG